MLSLLYILLCRALLLKLLALNTLNKTFASSGSCSPLLTDISTYCLVSYEFGCHGKWHHQDGSGPHSEQDRSAIHLFSHVCVQQHPIGERKNQQQSQKIGHLLIRKKGHFSVNKILQSYCISFQYCTWKMSRELFLHSLSFFRWSLKYWMWNRGSRGRGTQGGLMVRESDL